jgi:hypothetical protein
MSSSAPRRLWPTLWRGAKVLFGAWAFALVGVIIIAAATQSSEYLRYASVPLFLVGIAVMLRLLK